MEKYYVVSEFHTPFNRDAIESIDSDRIYINRTPTFPINGIIDETCSSLVKGHGEYDSYSDARRAVRTLFGQVHKASWMLTEVEAIKFVFSGTISVFATGKFERVDSDSAKSFIWENMNLDVKADSTDREVNDLVDRYEIMMNEMGYTIRWCARDIMVEYREQLKTTS